jgi:glycosyltransferase involved in cell wall biosynthesis
MRILHITETLEGASGVATFVRELDAALRAQGVESRVCNYVEQVEHVDVLHIHGLWLPPFHKAAAWARGKGIPIVWSTHGMTAPWAMHHKWWKKLPAWWIYQRSDLMGAAAIHCTTELEVGWNKALGFNNCIIAPLGTRENRFHSPTPTHNSNCTLLFVGRIYPVKGLVNLIKAWKILHGSTCSTWSNWKLRIVGPDQAGHKAELESLVDELGLRTSVEFAGPKFGDELSAEYEACDCLVLPSFTENFGATVVDAMAHRKPIITSKFTPWKEVQDRGCGWWTSNEPEKLAKAIMEMIEIGDEKRREMGFRSRKLVEEKYTWDAAAKMVLSEYRKLIFT